MLGEASKEGGASKVDEEGPVMQVFKKENIVSMDNNSCTTACSMHKS